MMLLQELMRVFGKVEQLSLSDLTVEHVVFDELPIPLLDAAHAGCRPATVDTVKNIANRFAFPLENRTKTDSFVRGGRFDPRQIANRRQHIEQVDITGGARTGLDPWTFDDRCD